MRGFTVVELILAISLVSILLVTSGVMMGRGLDAFNLVSSHTDAVEQARYGMIRMEKEMELVRTINTAQAGRFGFVDNQGLSTDFHLQGTDLIRGSDPLVRNVTSLTFTYYNSAGATTNTAPQVRHIRINMTVQAPGGAGQVTFRTEIYPRDFTYDTFQ